VAALLEKSAAGSDLRIWRLISANVTRGAKI